MRIPIKPSNTEPVRIPALVKHPVSESLLDSIRKAKAKLDQRGVDVRAVRGMTSKDNAHG